MQILEALYFSVSKRPLSLASHCPTCSLFRGDPAVAEKKVFYDKTLSICPISNLSYSSLFPQQEADSAM